MTDDPQNRLTIGRILRDLDPGQFWAVLVAFATVVGGCFWLGARFPLALPVHGSPIPCFEMPGWPRGQWLSWGRLESPPTRKNTCNYTRIPQITSEVTFVSSDSYETVTEQCTEDARKRVFTARTDKPLSAGATFAFAGSDETGYRTHATFTVRADGCMLDGRFGDTDVNAGSVHLLYESPRYYVAQQ
jgi:hypothetical protein